MIGNHLSSLKYISKNENLEILSANSCEIKDITEEFSRNLKKLHVLDLRANQIKELKNLNKIKKLNILILSENRLKDYNNIINELKHLENLKYLDIR